MSGRESEMSLKRRKSTEKEFSASKLAKASDSDASAISREHNTGSMASCCVVCKIDLLV